MRILFAAVRPGGWIALCEPDFNTIAVSPPSAAWVRTWTIFADAAVAGGWDPGYGTRMMSDLSTFDLEIFEGEASSRWVRGGSIGARLCAYLLVRFRDRMLSLGVLEADLEETQRLLHEPTATIRMPIIATAWGRRKSAPS